MTAYDKLLISLFCLTGFGAVVAMFVDMHLGYFSKAEKYLNGFFVAFVVSVFLIVLKGLWELWTT